MTDSSEEERAKEWADRLNQAAAKELWCFPFKYNGSNFSDIRDEQGHYYVDLVLGGGGMLGLAHAGFIHALEESDLKFRAVAGSSAGALSAGLLFNLHPEKQWKGLRIGGILAALNGDELLDNKVTRFLFRWEFKWKLPLTILPAFFLAFWALWERGLICGNIYEDKIRDLIPKLRKPEGDDNAGGDSSSKNLSPPTLTDVTKNEEAKDLKLKLVMVASDITTETKLELPPDEDIFELKEGDPTAIYIRASSGVPLIFRPVRMKLKKDLHANENLPRKFRKYHDYALVPPRKREKRFFFISRFFDRLDRKNLPLKAIDVVDGGLMSNFPISIFHQRTVDEKAPDLVRRAEIIRPPRLPTIGVQLRPLGAKPNRTRPWWNYGNALLTSMLDVGDEEFIKTNPDYRHVVSIVDTSEYEPFSLYLTDEQKIELFIKGYRAGKEFLRDFNWHDYKELRKTMSGQDGSNRG